MIDTGVIDTGSLPRLVINREIAFAGQRVKQKITYGLTLSLIIPLLVLTYGFCVYVLPLALAGKGSADILSILALLGSLYGLYLIYLGLPKLMKVPEDKTVPYIATVIGAGIVIVLIAGIIIQRVSAAFAPAVSGPYLVS